ncbi:MAG: DNA polymerase I [Chloroflexi bacterium CFX7]|nr:DNA polymerase I [Chloroflexi bacterium CFX7]MCK6563636.1 DNA polymerase I [Dehalococcoidia bacterium]
MPAPAKPRLVILDSHGILFRAFFALGSAPNPLMTSKGELSFATYGYAESLLRVIEQLRPTHICAAWDAPGKTFRHEAREEYKATRRETPSDLLPQMERVREMLEAFSIPVFEQPGFEADDLAGTIAAMAAERGIETYIVTLDTDLVQLIGPNVKLFMFRPYQRDTVVYDEAAAAERWGFSPRYMIDFKALKGDTSDNIEGIRGVGEKTATDLIRQFGPVESIYEHLDEVKSASLRQKLTDAEELVRRNKELVTIETGLAVDFDLDACLVRDFDFNRIAELFRELEFRSLLARLPGVIGHGTGTQAPTPSAPAETDYAVVTSAGELAALAAGLREAGGFAFAVLSTSADTAHSFPLGFSFATEAGRARYVPVGHAPRLDAPSPQLSLAEAREALAPLLADGGLSKTTYGTKGLLHLLERHGFTLEGADFDAAIAAFLLGETSSTLAALAGELLHTETISMGSLTGTGRNAMPLSQAGAESVRDYACEQASLLLRLRPMLEAELTNRGQLPLFREIELPLTGVLHRMEKNGVAVDISVLRDLSRNMVADIARAERAIFEMVGHEFNIASPQQLSDVLFKELGLPKTRKTTQGYSTDQRALESLRPVSPLIDLIFEYRQLTKLKSTYLDALPAAVAEDGRIHTDFQQTVAATGRLSSTNPNLQNIPVRTDTGRDIRRAFIAAGFDNAWLVAADYSQIELRVLAHITGDQGLIRAFLAGEDIHRATAATVYGVAPGEVTRQMRDTAKMVNFGIAYGMGEFGLASRTGMSREEADAFIKSYFMNFPGIAEWQQQILASTREKGYAESLFGRRRYLPAIRSTNFQVRGAAEREAINMPIQGTAADIIKVAMIRVDEEMRQRQLRSRMILQVHDELIFECPAEEVEPIIELARRLMPASIELVVPLKVDVKSGRNWGEMEPVAGS